MEAGSLFWGPGLGVLPSPLGTWREGQQKGEEGQRLHYSTLQYEEGEGKKTLHYPVLCQTSRRLRVFELWSLPRLRRNSASI
ncbi:hypothetical protein V8C35DRAFT_286913 [Trichoderma chlorosporum]